MPGLIKREMSTRPTWPPPPVGVVWPPLVPGEVAVVLVVELRVAELSAVELDVVAVLVAVGGAAGRFGYGGVPQQALASACGPTWGA